MNGARRRAAAGAAAGLGAGEKLHSSEVSAGDTRLAMTISNAPHDRRENLVE